MTRRRFLLLVAGLPLVHIACIAPGTDVDVYLAHYTFEYPTVRRWR